MFLCLFSASYASVLDLKLDVCRALPSLYGWCTNGKALYLIDTVLETNPKLCVEIGVFGGRSILPIAAALKHVGKGIVIGIDSWKNHDATQDLDEAHVEWWSKIDLAYVFHSYMKMIDQHELKDQIITLRTTSEMAFTAMNGKSIDLLHIDGNHSETASYFDVTHWVPLVSSGGRIIFDDISWDNTATQRAVQWLNEHCTKTLEMTDTTTWGVWIKP